MIDKKVALITGAGRGIGRGIAVRLAQAGWAVVINDISNPAPPAETLAMVEGAGSQGLVVLADITQREQRERLLARTLETFGRIDLLVNNAGIGPRVRKDILEVGEESLREVLEVNLIGPFFLTQKVVLAMLELIAQGRITNPKIINIGSISAFTSSPSRPEYCLSKAGVSMSTLLYADRLAQEGINVYEIRTGIIRTPMTEVVTEKYDRLIANGVTPIRRWGEPDDIGKAVTAIAEGYFPFSTGEVIHVDGGFHIQRL